MAWSKMVGFEVRPLTESSSMYRLSVPFSRMSRVMLSSQRLWPRSCSICVAFMGSPLLGLGSRTHVARIVPELDHGPRSVVLVAEGAQARCLEIEIARAAGLQPEPARPEHAEDVAAREDQHVAVDGAHLRHHAVGPGPDLRGRLAVGAAVAEEVPVRALGVDVLARAPFVAPVVPLEQICIDLGQIAEAGPLAGVGRALKRAGEDPGELASLEATAQRVGLALACLGQGQVGQARVLAGQSPGRLTVPGKIEDGKSFAHVLALLLGMVACRQDYTTAARQPPGEARHACSSKRDRNNFSRIDDGGPG